MKTNSLHRVCWEASSKLCQDEKVFVLLLIFSPLQFLLATAGITKTND